MARLTCAYCNNVISRRDTKCPYCGAETESAIKKFTEAREAETENNKMLVDGLKDARRKQVLLLVCLAVVPVISAIVLFVFTRPAKAKLIFLAALVSAYLACLVTGIKKINKIDAECRELNERIDGLSHDIIFDCEDVQPYKMINDAPVPNEGCFKDGLQQIAFKVRITNGSSRKIEFKLVNEFFGKDEHFGYHVRLNADGVRMKDCKLVPFFDHHEENNRIFEPPLYTEGFQDIVLRPHESFAGWVAFYVTPEAKDLELLFADDYVTVSDWQTISRRQ